MARRAGAARSVPAETRSREPGIRVGIALGSGSARGWAHIGVLRAIAEAGIEPDVVVGTSIGALVGAAYVAGKLDALEAWVRTITRLDIVRLLDLTPARGGFIAGARVFEQLRDGESDRRIEDLDKSFAAVATDLDSGREIWLREGSLLEAVRASISVPGLFTPHRYDGRWLVDGGLVNPVPISVCRALGAEFVIAVNLNADPRWRTAAARASARARDTTAPPDGETEAADDAGLGGDAAPPPQPPGARARGRGARLPARLRSVFEGTQSLLTLFGQDESDRGRAPSFFEVLATSVNIMQDRITRSRMAGDPPDAVVAPRLGHIRLLDYDRAAEAIDEGRACVVPALPGILRALGLDATPPTPSRA